jgi:hypothetical protein
MSVWMFSGFLTLLVESRCQFGIGCKLVLGLYDVLAMCFGPSDEPKVGIAGLCTAYRGECYRYCYGAF